MGVIKPPDDSVEGHVVKFLAGDMFHKYPNSFEGVTGKFFSVNEKEDGAVSCGAVYDHDIIDRQGQLIWRAGSIVYFARVIIEIDSQDNGSKKSNITILEA